MRSARSEREHVRRVVLAAYDHDRAESRHWRVLGPVARGREATVYEAVAADAHIAVKLLHAPVADATRLTQRYDAQRRYARAMDRWSDLSIAEPLGFLPEQRAIILGWVDAPTVERVVGVHGLLPRRHAALALQSGRWLGAFHRCEWARAAVIPADQELARLERRLAKLAPRRTFDSLDADLVAARDRLLHMTASIGAVPQARLHGDFKPSNLASDLERTIGYDVSGLAIGPVTRDIGRFLVHAEIDRRWLRVPRPAIGNPGFDVGTVRAFMKGYEETAEPIAEPHLRAGLLAEALMLWITLETRRVSPTARPIRRLRIWRLRHMVRALTGGVPLTAGEDAS